MKLFRDRARSDRSTKREAETTFGFLSRVDTPAFGRVRQLLNQWFDEYASEQGAEEAGRLRSSFHSSRDHQFYDAFWELYLHEVHRRLGFSIRAHPEVDADRRPDFELIRGEERFYLEAVKPNPSTGISRDTSANGGQIIEYIEEAPAEGFWLSVRFVSGGPELPRKRAIQTEVQRWLDGVREQLPSGNAKHPEQDLQVGDWTIGLTAHPRQGTGARRSAVGGYPGATGFPDAMADSLVPTLREKSTRYGDLDTPYVLAVWVMSEMSSPETVPRALFGGRLPLADGSHDLAGGLEALEESALWGRHSTARRRVSAVLEVDSFRFNYSSVSRTLPRLWLNPWADRPLAIDLPFPRSSVSTDFGRLDNRPALISAQSLLDLPSDWPGKPFAGLE